MDSNFHNVLSCFFVYFLYQLPMTWAVQGPTQIKCTVSSPQTGACASRFKIQKDWPCLQFAELRHTNGNSCQKRNCVFLVNFFPISICFAVRVLDWSIGMHLISTVVSRTLPGCYDLRQYQPYNSTSSPIGTRDLSWYQIHIYLPFTNFNIRFWTCLIPSKNLWWTW
jgi:hypothetical protein